MEHFSTDMSNRVQWPVGLVFDVQLGLRQTQELIKTKEYKKTCKKNKSSSSFSSTSLVLNQCMCLPKAELNIKNETKRPLLNGRSASFLMFNSITYLG